VCDMRMEDASQVAKTPRRDCTTIQPSPEEQFAETPRGFARAGSGHAGPANRRCGRLNGRAPGRGSVGHSCKKSPARERSAPSIRMRQAFARRGRVANVKMLPFPIQPFHRDARGPALPCAGIPVAPGADCPASRPTPGRPERNPSGACRRAATRPASTP
jgi:hypothetical protein